MQPLHWNASAYLWSVESYQKCTAQCTSAMPEVYPPFHFKLRSGWWGPYERV